MDIRGKEISPKETIENAEKILDSLGLTYTTDTLYSDIHTYSHKIKVYFKEFPDYIVHFTNGKGINEEYSLASGIAEMIERLSNMAVLANIDGFELDKYNGKYISYNEKIVEYKEVMKLKGYIEKCKYNYGRKFLESFKYFDEIYAGEDKSICLELTNIKDDSKCYVPLSHLLNDTNGMCAGNTKEEALCQGIFEMFERFSHNYIIENKINTPILPKEIYIGTYSDKIIQQIENTNRYKVVIKDCSLGMGIPIVGIILYDKISKTYRTSFGASYNYEIALERCLTEIVQNRTISELHMLDIYNGLDASSTNNMIDMSLTGIAHMPEEFLSNVNPNYEFKGNVILGKDNAEIFTNIKEILKNQDIDIYYFDNSYLGMNCYKLLSLELSFIKLLDNGTYFKNDLDSYKNIGSDKLTFEEADINLSKFFNEKRIYGRQCNILGVLNMREFPTGYIYNLHDLYIAVLLLKVGDIEGFVKFANYFLDEYNGANEKGYSLLKCLVHLYSYQLKGIDVGITVSILENIYSVDEIKKCLDVINDRDKAIKMFGFFDRDGQGEFNLCAPEFYKRYNKFINELNRRRIEAGK